MADLFMIPEVAKLIHPPGPLLKTVPANARTNVFCSPWQLDISEDTQAWCKHGPICLVWFGRTTVQSWRPWI